MLIKTKLPPLEVISLIDELIEQADGVRRDVLIRVVAGTHQTDIELRCTSNNRPPICLSGTSLREALDKALRKQREENK